VQRFSTSVGQAQRLQQSLGARQDVRVRRRRPVRACSTRTARPCRTRARAAAPACRGPPHRPHAGSTPSEQSGESAVSTRRESLRDASTSTAPRPSEWPTGRRARWRTCRRRTWAGDPVDIIVSVRAKLGGRISSYVAPGRSSESDERAQAAARPPRDREGTSSRPVSRPPRGRGSRARDRCPSVGPAGMRRRSGNGAPSSIPGHQRRISTLSFSSSAVGHVGRQAGSASSAAARAA
jgi:hypothetical protein